MVGEVLRMFQRAVVFKVGGDAGGAEGVIADLSLFQRSVLLMRADCDSSSNPLVRR